MYVAVFSSVLIFFSGARVMREALSAYCRFSPDIASGMYVRSRPPSGQRTKAATGLVELVDSAEVVFHIARL